MPLRLKLTEEVDEFLISQDPEELADILEVLYALADCLGLDAAGLKALRKAKADLRGGFAKRVVWHGPRPAVPAPVPLQSGAGLAAAPELNGR